jgi:hypothetical protein
MMTRYITTIALTSGIVLGAAATEGFHIYRQSHDGQMFQHDSQIFQERLRCKAIADAYVKGENSSDSEHGPYSTLDKVDYSPVRNSCVAEAEKAYYGPRAVVIYSVQDLLSGDTLFSVICAGDCGEETLRSVYVDRAFDEVMNNPSQPLELEKEARTFVQSKFPHKSATTPKIDPQTGEEINPGPK